MTRARNPWGHTARVNAPHAVYIGAGFEWRVLKSYQVDPRKPYARWFCAVKGPGTFGSYEMGDTYCADILRYGTPVTDVAAWCFEHPWREY